MKTEIFEENIIWSPRIIENYIFLKNKQKTATIKPKPGTIIKNKKNSHIVLKNLGYFQSMRIVEIFLFATVF